MGQQYARARAHGPAARLLASFVLERLRERSPGEGTGDPTHAVARRTGRDPDEVAVLLARAREVADGRHQPSRREATSLMSQLLHLLQDEERP
jgi:hypothetical protein